jgi:uroporphyrinogen-III decarboxylase
VLADSTIQSKSPAEQVAIRARRIADATRLRQPDCVPILMPFGNLLSQLEGIPNAELYADPEKAQSALEKAALRFQPDMCDGIFGTPEPSRALGDRMTKWPGYGLDATGSFQYHESEYMKVEDYDTLLADPSDFAIRRYLPRVFSELQGLSMLPPLGISLFGAYAMMQASPALAIPPVTAALEALLKAGRLQFQWVQQHIESCKRLAALGFLPMQFFDGPNVSAPFDFLSDTLRGMRGIFSDMRRCPEKLLAAEEKIIPIQLEFAIAQCKIRNNPYTFIPLHRGSDGFMSLQNFERFYWPQLKRVILALIEAGITPFILWEGCWNQRLEYIAQMPKGKTIGVFQNTDLIKAKEILGDVTCIVGGMPNGLLIGEDAIAVREQTHKMCEIVGKGGGFMMMPAIGDLQGCNPAMIETWAEATREFGTLR